MDFSKTRKSPILLQEISRKYALDPLRPIRGFVKLENNADKGLVTVIVENGGGGGSVAAPIAQKVLQKAIDLGL